MHSVVVYDSQFGNTERVAQVVAKALGDFGPARAAHVNETAVTQLRDVDLLVFGCPTQGFNASTAMRAFIEKLPPEVLRGPRVACFDTRMHVPRWMGRFAAPQLEKRLRKMGVSLCAPPAGFFVVDREGPLQEGEAERAAGWARGVGEMATSAQAGLAAS